MQLIHRSSLVPSVGHIAPTGNLMASPGAGFDGRQFGSADLVTPKFAVTAKHCVKTSSTNRTNNDLDVVFACNAGIVPAPTLPPDPRCATHTAATSGSIPYRFDDISGLSENDSAHDIAVIKFDRPVSAISSKSSVFAVLLHSLLVPV